MEFLGHTREDILPLLRILGRKICEGKMVVLAEKHKFSPHLRTNNWMTAKFFLQILAADGWNFPLTCRKACEYEPLL